MMNINTIITSPELLASIIECEKQAKPILQQYLTNFPEYTDHSIVHSYKVLEYAFYLLDENIDSLNEDEKYILIMAAYLHDIGMSPSLKIKEELRKNRNITNDESLVDLIREIHHEISFEFVEENWAKLKIPNKKYAQAIGLVCKGHRKVNLFDFDIFQHEFIVKGGSEFVCLPYLASILRLADELDITNDRTPELFFKNYYPKNKISIQEWEKHKSNYFINFKKDRIIITAECSNLNIYYGLVEQRTKIEKVLKEFHKLIRLLPIERKSISLKFHQIDHNIETKGFIPIKIGFSFDFQNTFNAFIGKNLYDSDFVAIREVVQNAIDTCLYKLSSNKSYKPTIQIELIEKTLTIEDNGLGMDYFIIENYFSKLNSSFYQQHKVSENYESIGQFGVGVFSYFLLCDYFDVETKTKNDNAIKFRITKNAENPFYFFEKTTKTNEGTKVILHLNNTLNFTDLINHIEHYFCFIDIPLTIKNNGQYAIEINKKSFNEDKSTLIANNINIMAKNRISELDVINCHLNTNAFEGQINLFITRKNNIFSPQNLFKVIDKYSFDNYNLYNKGIFINTYNCSLLKFTTGNINIKNRISLNLSRNKVKNDSVIISTIKTFENKLILQVFESWKGLTVEEMHENSNDFVKEYINTEYVNIETIEILMNNWVFKIYQGGKVEFIKLKELLLLPSFVLLNEYSAFSRFYSRGSQDSKNKVLFSTLKKPIVLIFDEYITKAVVNISLIKKFNIQMITTDENHLIEIIPSVNSTVKYSSLLRNRSFHFANDKSIVTYPNISVDCYFNSNHPINKYIIEKEDIIENNYTLKQLFDEFIRILSDFMFDYHLYSYHGKLDNTIIDLNNILFHINSTTKENFKLKKSDFPKWLILSEKKGKEKEKKEMTKGIKGKIKR